MGKLENISIDKLIVWSDNPRMANEQVLTEKEAMDILITEVGLDKMRVLAKDIFEKGLNPHRQPIVVPNENGSYNVYDGNRRISVIKCVLSNDNRFPEIKNLFGFTINSEILVYITDEKEALALIEVEHSGEAGGRGQIQWEAFQRDYAFVQNQKKALYPNAYQVSRICNLNRKRDFKQIPYTDLETIFSNSIVKRLFSVKDEWDYTNQYFIQEVYNRLLNAKPHSSYSRYLPQLKTEDKISEFKSKLFPKQSEGKKEIRDEVNSSEKDNLDYNSNNHDTTNNPSQNKDSQHFTNKEEGTPPGTQSLDERTPSFRNSYTVNPVVLFCWRGKGININNNAVFNHTLEFAIGLQINTDKELRRIAAYLYRLLLEIALKHWCIWFRSNKDKFNVNAISEFQSIENNILGTTSNEVSFISASKAKNIITIIKHIKDSTKNQNIKNCFKNRSIDSFSDMVTELNEVIHGTKEFIDNTILEKYDDMTLKYLIALSISMK